MKATGILLAAAFFLLAGCEKNIQSQEAVRQGVMSHLAGRAGLDLKSMDIEVTSVAFRDQEADATVAFRPKGSTDPAAGMQMKYTLERKGNAWVVKGRAEAGESPHGGSAMPPGHPPAGEAPPQGEAK